MMTAKWPGKPSRAVRPTCSRKWACLLLSGPIPTQWMPLVTWLSCRHLWQLIAHGSARQSSENCLSTSVFDPALIC